MSRESRSNGLPVIWDPYPWGKAERMTTGQACPTTSAVLAVRDRKELKRNNMKPHPSLTLKYSLSCPGWCGWLGWASSHSLKA